MDSLLSLINHLKQIGVLKTEEYIEAIKKFDRKDFIPEKLQNLAYSDNPLPIGEGQTISQPFTVAFMLELLTPKRDDKILDVGSGSGYTTALLAEIVGSKGKIFGVEIVPKLVVFGRNNLAKYHLTNAEIYQARKMLGLPQEAPFDKILVSASAKELPDSLVDQLSVGGIMVVPVGNEIWKIKKGFDNDLKIEKYEGFVFVPLVEK